MPTAYLRCFCGHETRGSMSLAVATDFYSCPACGCVGRRYEFANRAEAPYAPSCGQPVPYHPHTAQVLQASAELVDRFWSDEPVDEWEEKTKVEAPKTLRQVAEEWHAQQRSAIERMHEVSP